MTYVFTCFLGVLVAASAASASATSFDPAVEIGDLSVPAVFCGGGETGAPAIQRIVITLDGLPVLYVRVPDTPAADVAAVRETGEEALLRAVRVVETGDNPRAVGRLGERGSYQFRRSTWREITRRPFREAHTPAAHDVARVHLSRLADGLRAKGLPVDSFHLALAWNAGINGAAARRPPHSAVDYARRVSALAGDIARRSSL